jgi:LmbE family N-acetylglucosaminyl deacetylase
MAGELEPVDEGFQRALCIVAHPDDLEYGIASVVARWTAQGKAVGYVMVTSGEAGIDGIPPAECGPLREEEERRSAAVVGVDDVAFLGLPDGLLEPGLDLRRAIAGEIRRFRPDVVLTLSHELVWLGGAVNHADHRAVGVATLDACRDAANRWLWPELGEPAPAVQAAYVAPAEPATHYVDVAATLDLGIRSLEEHRAYIDGLGTGFDPASFLRGNAEEAGREAGVELAVAFRRLGV